MRKTYKRKKALRRKKQRSNTQRKNAGMFSRLAITAATALVFSMIQKTNGHVVYTVCRGNTCRSPFYASYLERLLGVGEWIVSSFGTYPRTEGNKMAPESEKFAKELCKNDQECINRVQEHSSSRMNCREIKQQIADGHDITIIPMDPSVEYDVTNQISECFNTNERSHIYILPNANITDPFPTQGTPLEEQGYKSMRFDVERSASNVAETLKGKNGRKLYKHRSYRHKDL